MSQCDLRTALIWSMLPTEYEFGGPERRSAVYFCLLSINSWRLASSPFISHCPAEVVSSWPIKCEHGYVSYTVSDQTNVIIVVWNWIRKHDDQFLSFSPVVKKSPCCLIYTQLVYERQLLFIKCGHTLSLIAVQTSECISNTPCHMWIYCEFTLIFF